MPPYLPWHEALVYISAIAEIGLGGDYCCSSGGLGGRHGD